MEIDRTAVDRIALDQTLGLIDAHSSVRVRSKMEDARIGDTMLWSRWKPWDDVTVETWLWWDGPWQMRTHRIDTPHALTSIEGAAAISVPDDAGAIERQATDHGYRVTTARDLVGIVDLGWTGRVPELHRAEPNTNLLAPRTLIPRLRGDVAPGVSWLHTAILAGSAELTSSWQAPPTAMLTEMLEAVVPTLAPVGAVRRASDAAIPPVPSGRV